MIKLFFLKDAKAMYIKRAKLLSFAHFTIAFISEVDI